MIFYFNKKTAVIIHDAFMVVLAWQASWWLRFNLDFPFYNWELSLYILPLALVVQLMVYGRFKLHRGLWHFASIADLWNIFRASVIGGLSITLVLFISIRLDGVPRSVLILYPVLLMFFLGAPRLGYRIWREHFLNLNDRHKKKSVLVIGSGSASEMLIRDMLKTGKLQPSAIIDDNPDLAGSEIHNIRVVGNISEIPMICKERNIDAVIIAMPSATSQQMQKIMLACEQTDCEIRTLPNLQDLVTGKISVSQLRNVQIEDLLSRDKVNLDFLNVREGIHSKSVMVTGGGGSIGSELCLQIASYSPSKLTIIDHNEFNLYRIEQKLGKLNIEVEYILGNLCNKMMINNTISRIRPDIIYHTAAYKHVPILERQPHEAVINNILGTKYIADAAGSNQCERFILISTDKAVNPVNVLGATKRAAEMYTEILNGKYYTKYITVRFGNVLDSEGSVVPLFRQQIKSGGPITVTHPAITRYFMTISEAGQLIMQAGSMGNGGEIFVLDMGEPVKISFIAEQMIRLSGLEPDADIKIEYSGLRLGEKMHEELFYENESIEDTEHKKIFIAKHPVLNEKNIKEKIDALNNAIDKPEPVLIENLLGELVNYKQKNSNVIQIPEVSTQ